MELVTANDEQLQLLNNSLDKLNQQLFKRKLPQHCVLFVIGVPRSGTTLLTQILIENLKLGYISNTIARFWQCPAVGALLQNTFFQQLKYTVGNESEFGATKGPLGPHEFGFFWKRWFTYEETHYTGTGKNGEELAEEIASLENILDNPMMFKNLAACSLHAKWLSEVLPSARFLLIRRHPIDVARSIHRARVEREGSIDKWFSVKPPSYPKLKTLPVEEQIAYQILDTELHISNQLQAINSDRWAVLEYEQLLNNPSKIINLAESLIQCGFRDQPDTQMISVGSPASEKIPPLDRKIKDIVLNNSNWQKLYN